MHNVFDLPLFLVDRIIDRALEEDLSAGDVTTEACIDMQTRASAYAVARQELLVCGGMVFQRVFQRIDPRVEFEVVKADGALVGAGTKLWKVQGRARALLMGERVALNLVQRMSGVATLTHSFVRAVPVGAGTRITDTRKTTPGLRVLERYAVRVGGGKNHREHLGAAVLIKDNHIVACGGVARAVERAKKHASHTSRIECEVDTLQQLEEALNAGADIILLDNMDNGDIAEAVRRARGRAITEASGGITLERVPELARAGVDVLSVGALTHSARAVDIGFDFTGAEDPASEKAEDESQVSMRA